MNDDQFSHLTLKSCHFKQNVHIYLFYFFSRRETINRNLWRMTLDQRLAFGLWYSKAMTPSNITRGHQSLIRDTGNLIAYLPFHNFQHLSPAQVTDLWALTPGWETWGSQDSVSLISIRAQESYLSHTAQKKAQAASSVSVITTVSYACS